MFFTQQKINKHLIEAFTIKYERRWNLRLTI